MKLELKFVGTEPIPARLIAQILSEIDGRLAILEASRILSLSREFPELRRENHSAALRRCYLEFKAEYNKNSFSMLQVQEIENGCLILSAVLLSFGARLVKATLGESFKEFYKESELNRSTVELLRKIDRYFFVGQPKMLHDGVLHVAEKHNKKHAVGRLTNKSLKDGEEVIFKNIRAERSQNGPDILKVEIKVLRVKPTLTYEQLEGRYNSGK